MAKRSSDAHSGAKEVKILSFDPDDLVIVDDPAADLADDRGQEMPPESFILNLMHYGVLQSITVKKNNETSKTEVVDGRKRTLGLREANKRLKKKGEEPWRIPAVPKRGTSGEAIGMMISANTQRFEESPLGLAKKIARAIDRGRSEEEVARDIGRSVATVKNMLKLLDAPAAVRHAVESGKISTSDGYKLSGMEVDEAKKKVAELIEHAPRTPGKKRSKNASKARDIVSGAKGSKAKPSKTNSVSSTSANHEGMRAVNQVENLKRELEERDVKESGSDALSRGAIVALQWVLGQDVSLEQVFKIKWP